MYLSERMIQKTAKSHAHTMQHCFKTVKSRANPSWAETSMTAASAVCASSHLRRFPQGNISFRSRRHAAGSETALQTGSLNPPFPNLSPQPIITPFLRPAVSSHAHTHTCTVCAISHHRGKTRPPCSSTNATQRPISRASWPISTQILSID